MNLSTESRSGTSQTKKNQLSLENRLQDKMSFGNRHGKAIRIQKTI